MAPINGKSSPASCVRASVCAPSLSRIAGFDCVFCAAAGTTPGAARAAGSKRYSMQGATPVSDWHAMTRASFMRAAASSLITLEPFAGAIERRRASALRAERSRSSSASTPFIWKSTPVAGATSQRDEQMRAIRSVSPRSPIWTSSSLPVGSAAIAATANTAAAQPETSSVASILPINIGSTAI